MSKEKYVLEYGFRSVPVMLLWSYISSPSGLKEWFADSVEANGKTFTFVWDGQAQNATVIASRTGVSIKFRWEGDKKEYFEMKISVSELTDSTVLSITDFAEKDEIEDSSTLWNSQVDTLRRMIGC